MQRTLSSAIGRALFALGLVLSLLSVPLLTEQAHATNPDCAPSAMAMDEYSRTYLFTGTTLCDWVVPAGWGSVTVQMIGGGGGGGGGSWAGTHGGGGGGGGAGGIYVNTHTLTAGSRVPIQVGAGGSAGTGASTQGGTTGTAGGDGGSTIFNASDIAVGGFGGAGGSSDMGGAGGANGGKSSTGTATISIFNRRSGGSQNNGNGGGGTTAMGYELTHSATSTYPADGSSSGTLYPRTTQIGYGGGGGANQTSALYNGNSYPQGGSATRAADQAIADTGSGGNGGHGCGSSASTCLNRNGTAGSSGFILITAEAGAMSSISNATETVGETPTVPTLTTKGSIGSLTWSVSPALPAGFSFNTSTGVISGIPTVASPYTQYLFGITDSFGAIKKRASWQMSVKKGNGAKPTFNGANIVFGVPTALSASGGSGTGAITFTSSNADCALTGTRGETVTALTDKGTCSITATKAGDANWYTSSTSATFTRTKQVASVSIAASPTSPLEADTAITITATVGSGQTGTVTFSAGGSPISACGSSGAVTISGTSATCLWTPNSSGSPYTLAASYSGDSIYQSAIASTISYTIYPSIGLTYPGISTTFGTSKTSTPTITGGTGTTSSWTWSVVKASDSSSVSGITISSTGVVSASSAVATGTYAMRVTATDTVGITKSVTVNVVVGLSSAASPTVTSAESTMTAGGVVHLTASVISAATGTIAFKYGSTTITGCGTVAISSGTASCDWTTSTAAGSPFSVTAVYSGDGSYSTATSSAISVTVVAAATFTYTSQSKQFGDLTYVTPVISGGVGPFTSWSVVNSADSQSVGGVYINQAGVVTISTAAAVGTYTLAVTATDANSISGSGTLSLTIAQATTTMTLSAKTVDGRVLTSGTLGRQVRLVVAFNIPVMGSVTISDARGTICTTFAGSYSAECWWAPSDATYAPYALTATFGGNSNGTAATSNTLTNFTWNPAMSVAHANTSVETGKTVTITPTTSGGTGAVSTWSWGISQYFTGYSIGGITINSSGVIRVAGSVEPATYSMVVQSGDLAGTFYNSNVTITVSDVVAPDITLSLSSETVTVGSAITGFTITNAGSEVDSYSIDQSLPNGLTFSSSTGLISGTPTETTTSLIITLSASNFGGIDTATYTLTVNASGGGGGGSATITISLTGGSATAAKGTPVTITATVNTAGKVKFLANGKVIGGCAAKNASNSATCSWKPAVQGQSVALTAILNPTSGSYATVKSSTLYVGVVRRTGRR